MNTRTRDILDAAGLPLRHIIFDLDSTLSDSLRTIALTRSNLLNRLCAIAPSSKHDLLRKTFRAVLTNDIHDTEIVPKLRPILQSMVRCEEIEVIHRQFLKDVEDSTELLEGGRELLTQLVKKGISMVIWSNKRAPFVSRHAKGLGLAEFFEKIYCQPSQESADSVDETLRTKVVVVPPTFKKPSPAFLYRVLRENNFDETATVFVGNNVQKDGGSTIGTSVRFVYANFGIPTLEIQNLLFELTGSEKLSFPHAKINHREPTRADFKVAGVVQTNLLELLSLFD